VKGVLAVFGTLLVSSLIGATASAGSVGSNPLEIIYSNYFPVPGNLYRTHAYYSIAGDPDPLNTWNWTHAAAMPFSPTRNAVVKKISLALGHAGVPAIARVRVTLHQDSGSGLPGMKMASFKVTEMPNSVNECCETETHKVDVPVTAGTLYWLAVTPLGPTTIAGWNLNAFGSTGPVAVLHHEAWWPLLTDRPGELPPLAAFQVLGR
jgi:hypothetical protein